MPIADGDDYDADGDEFDASLGQAAKRVAAEDLLPDVLAPGDQGARLRRQLLRSSFIFLFPKLCHLLPRCHV